jgi:hypothetical protein
MGIYKRYEIKWIAEGPERAEGVLQFVATTELAASHLRVALGHWILSAPMREIEAAE